MGNQQVSYREAAKELLRNNTAAYRLYSGTRAELSCQCSNSGDLAFEVFLRMVSSAPALLRLHETILEKTR